MLESLKNSKNGILYNKIYLNLRSKFFLVFFVLVIVPFFILGFVAYQRSKASVEHNFYSISILNLRHTDIVLDNYLKELRQLTDDISEDQVLSSSLVKGINKSIELPAYSSLRFNSKLECIYFITANRTYHIYSKKAINSSPDGNTDFNNLYRTAVSNPGACILVGTNIRFFKGGIYNYVVSALKAVKDPASGKTIGAYLVDYSYDALASLLKTQQINEFKESELYVTDNGNNVMYSVNKGLLTLKLDYTFIKDSVSSSSPMNISKDKKRMYLLSSRLSGSSWKAYELIPSSNITKRILAVNSPLFIFIFICFILLMIFPVVLLSMFFKPLSKLSIAISGKENDNFSNGRYDAKETRAKDVTADYNSSPNFDGLINKVYYSRLKQKEVQLVALQNQINPHFLYNTLESIRGAALHHGIQSIASMAKNLSSFFRYSIGEEVLVPIKDEIQHLENYIAIQNFRHDDKFELAYKLPEDLNDYKILKLTLQPLVENSIKHGLEMKIGKGKIKIDILWMESIIKIRIFDDGIGMPQEKIVELNRILEDDIPIHKDSTAGSGVGVRNVNSRIKLYFGEQYGIRYLGHTEGTTVEVTFPAVK